MKTSITREQIPALFAEVAQKFDARQEELCAMDARMGDGDLGLTMKRGFGSIPEFLAAAEEADIGKALMRAGMNMASVAPSTMGTLMASGLMQAGKAVSGMPALDAELFASFLRGYADGIAKRGKCTRGQCTVLDCIAPAADAAREAADAGGSLADVAAAARTAGAAGTAATAEMIPVYGKAAVHQNIASGVIDQGAYAGLCLLEGLCAYVEA